jgi:superfamily I DNA/RNA helicase
MLNTTYCTVTTLKAATGLEAPMVILLGVDHLLENEQDIRLPEEEGGDLRRDHTRMLYLGFTRAGQRLVVLRTGISDSLLPLQQRK